MKRGVLAVAALLTFAKADEGSAQVPVAARDLPRGATLEPADIRYEDATAEPGLAAADEHAVGAGWVTRRVIARGEPLREPAVGRPLAVRSGESVALVWTDGAIQLRLRGTAMGGAAVGERVLVRIDSRRRIEGIAAAPGLVRVNGGTR